MRTDEPSTTPRVVAVGRQEDAVDVERAVFEAAGIELETHPRPGNAELPASIRTADGILHSSWDLTADVIEQLRCRVIGRYGIGYDNIDVEAATEQGIAVVNVPGYCVDEIAEHVLAFTLAWHRCLPFYDRDRFAASDLERPRSAPTHRIADLTGGLCAFGDIARGVAARWQALGMDVLSFDPYVPTEDFAAHGVTQVSFEDLLAASDVVSVHTPLTDETRQLIDADAFDRMQSHALLVNTARGEVVHTGDLLAALRRGAIAGACLDVVAGNDDEQQALRDRPDVLLTPHIAYLSEQSVRDLHEGAATGVRDVLEGRRPPGLVNPAVTDAQLFD